MPGGPRESPNVLIVTLFFQIGSLELITRHTPKRDMVVVDFSGASPSGTRPPCVQQRFLFLALKSIFNARVEM
jgi:hypothetical protein